MSRRRKASAAGLVLAADAVLLVVNYYPTLDDGLAAMQARGGGAGLVADILTSPAFLLTLLVIGIVMAWEAWKEPPSDAKTMADDMHDVEAGPKIGAASVRESGNSQSSATASGNSVVVNVGAGPALPLPTRPAVSPDPPRIRIVEEGLSQKQLVFNPGTYKQFKVTAWFVRLKNNEKGDKRVFTAKNVRADILITDANGFNQHIQGYWIYDFANVIAEMEKPYDSSPRQAWLEPGERKHLVLCIKTNSGPSVCGFDHWSWQTEGLKRMDLVLPKGTVSLTVELNANGVDESLTYVLTNTESDYRVESMQ